MVSTVSVVAITCRERFEVREEDGRVWKELKLIRSS